MRISDWSSDVCASELLQTLELWDTRVTDEGLAHLAGMRNLKRLNLQNTKITDKGIGQLRSLTVLESIKLGKKEVTDAGLSPLCAGDRKSAVQGTSVSVRVDLGGRRFIKKKTQI